MYIRLALILVSFFIVSKKTYSQECNNSHIPFLKEIKSITELKLGDLNWNNVVLDSIEINIVYNRNCEPRIFYILKHNNSMYFVGRKVRYIGAKTVFCESDTCKGINNTIDRFINKEFHRYNSVNFKNTEWEYWANFILPIQKCESASSSGAYASIITNDGTSVTIGFLQLAAHVKNGDFVSFLKLLLAKYPELLKNYFPDLTLVDNHICKITDGKIIILDESNHSEFNVLMMEYFNNDKKNVEQKEIINFAKFSHLLNNNIKIQQELDTFSIRLIKDFIPRISYLDAEKYFIKRNLLDYHCLVICDLFHNQGESNSIKLKILSVFKNENLDAFEMLEELILISFDWRESTLRSNIKQLIKEKKIGYKIYDFKNRYLKDGLLK